MRVGCIRLTPGGLHVNLGGIHKDGVRIRHDGGMADDRTAGDGR
jgi:hypothetical protein